MSSEKITNEQIFKLVKKFKTNTDRWFHDIRAEVHDLRDEQRDQRQELRSIRQAVELLQKTRLTWSVGLLAGVVAASSIASIILIRLLSAIGMKVVDNGLLQIV